jgi:hypothetical protein
MQRDPFATPVALSKEELPCQSVHFASRAAPCFSFTRAHPRPGQNRSSSLWRRTGNSSLQSEFGTPTPRIIRRPNTKRQVFLAESFRRWRRCLTAWKRCSFRPRVCSITGGTSEKRGDRCCTSLVPAYPSNFLPVCATRWNSRPRSTFNTSAIHPFIRVTGAISRWRRCWRCPGPKAPGLS